MTIDLHVHTTASDGTDSPDVLMTKAVAAGLTAVGVTDHDSADGWAAVEEARPAGLTVVRGAEISTHINADDRPYSIHVLGYLFDPHDAAIAAELTRLRSDRMERGLRIIDRMTADGVPISREQVLDLAADAPVGRPHIGRALMAAGLVGSVDEAFRSYLSGRGPYYVAKADTRLQTAIELVRSAGGVPVIAHPRSRGAKHLTDEAFFRRCADHGLAGIEVDHPDHDAADRAELRALARRFGLIITGSSDYHGSNKSVRLGVERSTEESLAALVELSSGVTPLLGPGV